MENDAANQRQYLTFFLAGEQYAVGVLSVQGDHRVPASSRTCRRRRRASAASSTCAAASCRWSTSR